MQRIMSSETVIRILKENIFDLNINNLNPSFSFKLLYYEIRECTGWVFFYMIGTFLLKELMTDIHNSKTTDIN